MSVEKEVWTRCKSGGMSPLPCLLQVLKKVGDKKPWKYIDAVAVEGVTFGLSPPQLQFANAKFDPSRQHLQIQLNMRFNSNGFQAVVSQQYTLQCGSTVWKYCVEVRCGGAV